MIKDPLALLHHIGGEVADGEVLYHLDGDAAALTERLIDLAEDGLIEMRTYWTVTDAGRKKLGVA